jgi:hypothetical protein
VEPGIDLQGHILMRHRDSQRPFATGDGLSGVSQEQVMGTHKGRQPAQPARIVEVFNQGVSLA